MEGRRLGQGMVTALALSALAALAACGGNGQSRRRPVAPDEEAADSEAAEQPEPDDEAPTDEVGMEHDLRRIFERKQSSVARC